VLSLSCDSALRFLRGKNGKRSGETSEERSREKPRRGGGTSGCKEKNEEKTKRKKQIGTSKQKKRRETSQHKQGIGSRLFLAKSRAVGRRELFKKMSQNNGKIMRFSPLTIESDEI
jgi:hypothetical protein